VRLIVICAVSARALVPTGLPMWALGDQFLRFRHCSSEHGGRSCRCTLEKAGLT
jgi:hypothetical protein